MNAYERHKVYINNYVLSKGQPAVKQAPSKTDSDILRENYKFVRTDEDSDESTWEKRVAKKYYDKLFKEYCLADLSLYKDGHVGSLQRHGYLLSP